MTELAITSVSLDRSSPWRAHYVWVDEEANVQHRRDIVVGWAAVGDELLPVRVEPMTGRGLLVGTDRDPDNDYLVGVIPASDSWEDLPGMDEHVRALIRSALDEVETGDDDE